MSTVEVDSYRWSTIPTTIDRITFHQNSPLASAVEQKLLSYEEPDYHKNLSNDPQSTKVGAINWRRDDELVTLIEHHPLQIIPILWWTFVDHRIPCLSPRIDPKRFRVPPEWTLQVVLARRLAFCLRNPHTYPFVHAKNVIQIQNSVRLSIPPHCRFVYTLRSLLAAAAAIIIVLQLFTVPGNERRSIILSLLLLRGQPIS